MAFKNRMPLSFFESVRNPDVIETLNPTFDEFVDLMISFADDEYPQKEAAPLFASTQFNHRRRRKANANTSGLIVLDIDHGQTIDETWDIVEALDVSALLYSTASHRDDHHKFRLCVPLNFNVRYQEHVKVWHALDYTFIDGMSDSSKVGCESLFYFPGKYPNAPSVLKHHDGMILSADDWFDVADLQDVPFDKPSNDKNNQTSPQPTNLSAVSSSDLDIYETRLVTEAALNKYQSSIGDWHHARFGLMMSIVGRAKRLGIAITTYDIIHLFNQVDQIDGGHYQTPKYQKEIANDAANALAQAG